MEIRSILTTIIGMSLGVLLYYTVQIANACSCVEPRALIQLSTVEGGDGASEEQQQEMRQRFAAFTQLDLFEVYGENADDYTCLSTGKY
ncbi:MAG: hypothetical protein JXR76_14470 [Deltaproteobacteria bacterium]|nr:hypothetical protein [Deltaproteobacteria bacterium]